MRTRVRRVFGLRRTEPLPEAARELRRDWLEHALEKGGLDNFVVPPGVPHPGSVPASIPTVLPDTSSDDEVEGHQEAGRTRARGRQDGEDRSSKHAKTS